VKTPYNIYPKKLSLTLKLKIMKILAIALIVLGSLALAYQGFTYTKTDQVAKIGSLEITADTQKTIPISPIVGIVAMVAGGAILFRGRNQNN